MATTDTHAATDLRPVRATLVLGFGALVTHGFGLSLVPAMLVFIAAELRVGYGILGAVVAAGLVAYSLGATSSGWILDRVPNRGALAASYAISGLGLAVAALAGSVGALAVATVIMGFSAPVSWSATIHIAGSRVPIGSRAMVMSGASSGAAVGVLINGVLVRTSSTLHSWRVSFAFAAILALVAMVGGLVVIRGTVARPSMTDSGRRGAFRRTLAFRPGRVVVAAGLVAGLAGFPFSTFLTATALEELEVSSLATGMIWWLIGGLGALAGPALGRLGDRQTPLRALTLGAVSYCAGLILLVATWNYFGLVAAAIGFAFMNYPIWGLTGAIANERFAPGDAMRVVSLGLVGASLGGAFGNWLAGWWIERTASFRGPVSVLAAVMAALCVWYLMLWRTPMVEDRTGGAVSF